LKPSLDRRGLYSALSFQPFVDRVDEVDRVDLLSSDPSALGTKRSPAHFVQTVHPVHTVHFVHTVHLVHPAPAGA